MHPLEFVAALVEALAWPVTVLIIVFLLRHPLAGLIPLLQRLKYRDLELEFGRRLEAAKSEADATTDLPTAPSEELPPAEWSPFIERVAKLAETSPRAAVIEAWREVETTAAAAAQRHGYIGSKISERTPANLVRALRKTPQMDRSIVALLEDLRGLRNQAAHGTDFALSADSALEFAFLSERVIEFFRRW